MNSLPLVDAMTQALLRWHMAISEGCAHLFGAVPDQPHLTCLQIERMFELPKILDPLVSTAE